jgi:hypothetical protein
MDSPTIQLLFILVAAVLTARLAVPEIAKQVIFHLLALALVVVFILWVIAHGV